MTEEKEKTPEELEKEAEERRVLEERRIARRKKEARDEKIKVALEILFLICVLGGYSFYNLHKWTRKTFRKLDSEIVLNATTQQVSQIIDNIRQTYAIYSEEKEISMARLIELGAVPDTIVVNKEAINLYGGNIVIQPSRPIENVKEAVESPTFKMSYQGLPHDVCVNMALMDWGDKVKGLMAIAIGEYDGEQDSALEEIDKIYKEEEPIILTDKFGRQRTFQPPKHYQFNVAKPGDDFMPSPFSRDNAENGCSCGLQDNTCSFAWRYAIYAIDKPNRVESELEKMERLMKENLEKRLKEQEDEQKRLREEEIKKRVTEELKANSENTDKNQSSETMDQEQTTTETSSESTEVTDGDLGL